MQRVRAHELRKMEEPALVDALTNQRKELAALRVSKVSNAPQVKLAKIKQVRKAIAKVLTVISEKRIAAARSEFGKKKYLPKDLRQRKTRAFRRRLTRHESNLKTAKVQKKLDNQKLRKFAVAM
eukprot:CAMPEP_0176348438 /NCGR_PEP_ID=MMETSP0126-20121128/7869_1 /TAXON_ID=141414 ORGANISM="Strombidinopsis acuminatum, Strain SPMC142" /NCGR_SAMPLE_ID=MMETSP0126 /ASSEMBLY_ACC=CAM_ASM_000229 /LENGTH=123 /DNA_ID=CAMNT_0017697237 /DNA_START=32 /DNA_END=403 /DNA_ORIENTATION=+